MLARSFYNWNSIDPLPWENLILRSFQTSNALLQQIKLAAIFSETELWIQKANILLQCVQVCTIVQDFTIDAVRDWVSSTNPTLFFPIHLTCTSWIILSYERLWHQHNTWAFFMVQMQRMRFINQSSLCGWRSWRHGNEASVNLRL